MPAGSTPAARCEGAVRGSRLCMHARTLACRWDALVLSAVCALLHLHLSTGGLLGRRLVCNGGMPMLTLMELPVQSSMTIILG